MRLSLLMFLAAAATLLIHAAEIQHAPRLTPQEALATFQLPPDLRIELVAAEPLVVDPVDMAFDEDGRLYVAEMIDYPIAHGLGRGRIRLLESTRGDGVYDRSEIFCDGLVWPTSIACWKGGVLVAAAPSIWYFKDTKGTGKADLMQELFTGFGNKNVQALLNNIKWGQENQFVCASGGNGGKIKSLLKPELPEISISGRDFRFLPSGECEAITGGGQFGLTFDDFGRRFVCSNSVQARHIVLEERYLKRNPFLPVASAVANIASDGDAAPVFRTSPVEQWRVLRTQMRLSGESPGLLEYGGKAAGYFTSATGITMYRGTAMGKQYYGNLFIGEVAGNLVHRKTLTPNGATFRADRVDPGSEFLTSTDISFRPVNFANGPDGALYICDMTRECIEHPESIPDRIKQTLDLNSNGRGRIWRITAKNAPKANLPHMSAYTAAELVDALRNENSWSRETAARLIFERQDKSIVPALEALAAQQPRGAGVPPARISSPASRAAALWALDGLSALRPEIISAALHDESPDVREQALRLAESPPDSQLKAQLLSLEDSNPRVQFQLALTLGELDDATAAAALARLALKSGSDIWLRAAILSSSAKCSADLLAAAPNANAAFVHDLAFTIGARNDANEIAAALAATKSTAALTGLADGMRRKGARLLDKHPELQSIFTEAAVTAKNRGEADAKRLDAIRLLAYGDAKTAKESLPALIAPNESIEIQAASLRVLSSFDDPAIGAQLIESWKSLAPALRSEALKSWFNRPARLQPLMEAVEQKKIAPNELSAEIRKQLRAHFKERAAALIEEQSVDRKSIIEKYQPALALKGDTQRGLAVFQKICASCHRAAGAGHDLGPDLETVAHRGPDELLVHILDPNREVAAQYCLQTIVTTDGRVLEGILASQSASSVTLKRALGETSVILRSEIKTMLSSTRSPMPEGLESSVDFQAMADLMEYIRTLGKK
ncbi:MAG TPA: PVC-type heme-binding CxxCH protein [Planctomycetota bacterium]|nr:PVC-type heme-binding CxxCH protein [Planctomycetota bacterium]